MPPNAKKWSENRHKQISCLLTDLAAVVGTTNLLTKASQQQSYVQGAIEAITDATAAVVIPNSLVALWRVINICAAADAIIIA